MKTIAAVALGLVFAGGCKDGGTPPTPSPPAPTHQYEVEVKALVTEMENRKATLNGLVGEFLQHASEQNDAGLAGDLKVAVERLLVNDLGPVKTLKLRAKQLTWAADAEALLDKMIETCNDLYELTKRDPRTSLGSTTAVPSAPSNG